MLSHARALPSPPALPRRHLLHVYPYAPVDRSPAPLSLVSQPRCRSLGQLSLSTRFETLRVQRLSAHLQRLHQHAPLPEQTVARALDPRDLSVVPRLFLPAHRQGVGNPCPYQLSLVLVAAQCCPIIRNGA